MKNRLKAAIISIMLILTTTFSGTVSGAEDVDVNFAKALQYSIFFYDANMCGTEVDENNLYDWRGDCHTYDSMLPLDSEYTNLSAAQIAKYGKYLDPDGDGFVDVAGGFHDAGDHVEFGMPEAYSGSVLGWGYYEFRDSYKKTGQDAHIETILRYFNDYFMKSTYLDEKGDVVAFCYQVGEGEIDHAYWNSPEVDEMKRMGFFLTSEKPQTDYVVAHAASLAMNYLNFKDTDPEYAKKSLDYAKALFKFAEVNPKELSDNADGPRAFYASNKWEDDYCWAAAALFLCTEDVKYLESALPYIDYYAPPGWRLCWNDMWNASATLWGIIDLQYPQLDVQNMYRKAQGKTEYEDADFWKQIAKGLDQHMANLTPGGYGFYDTWGSARYNTAVQYTALVYDKYKNNGKPGKYSEWAYGQMEYLMGKNPINRCYIVGYSDISAKFPHHRAASGLTKCEDLDPQRYVLYGALVGGPDGKDQHFDVTSDWIYNEVTIDYNAAFVGACAGLYEFFGTSAMTVTPDFPPATGGGDGPGAGGNDYWVEAYAADNFTDTGAGVTKLSLKVRTNSTKKMPNVSIRYFIDISEMANKNISAVACSQLYDQAATEAGAVCTTKGPFQYENDPNIYYFEIDWGEYNIVNSNKMHQMTIGFYYGDIWDPSNDWSYKDILKHDDIRKEFDGTETRTDYICVYSDGVLIGGIEPNGKTPETLPTTAPTVTTTPAITTTAPTAPTTTSYPDGTLIGDVNLDEEINTADLILLAKHLSNRITLKGQMLINADCNSTPGINGDDLLALIKYFTSGVSLPL